ncbi:MAG: tRNA uridine-5-carboxymethylaminomethyl(34) synthesis GTPase MnmE [Lachnospiraceae bacterium]|nr:tRNA uridine-5-carboxymethylaminomethyl(34) synthesis GTPase MnmE [Lachnospiraceae bacterium]
MKQYRDDDTIAAISSGMTEAGIGIVRVSGPEALKIAEKTVRIGGKPASDLQANTVHVGLLMQGDTVLDQAVVLTMRAPKSYTGEDVVELQCHGGPYLLRRVLQTVLDAGARLAMPGEFTRRAFLNGRMDLSQAEAVMDLIGSHSEYERASAMDQLSGSFSSRINDLRSRILYETAFLEAAVDDPEHISTEGYAERLAAVVKEIRAQIADMIQAAENARVFKAGIRTVILGSPNVGKSSILNLLLGSERAIVTEIPGTTRDVLEEAVRVGDLTLLLADTAGIRRSEDTVERIGIELAEKKAEAADLILYVIDAAQPASQQELMQAAKWVKNKKAILLLNKTDLPQAADVGAIREITGLEPLSFSARTGEGRKELYDKILTIFSDMLPASGEYEAAANLRHLEELRTADKSLALVEEAIAAGMPEDLFTIDLMDAYTALSRIVGDAASEALVDEIFSKFCMGK